METMYTDKEKIILQHYYKKKKQKRIIAAILLVLCVGGFTQKDKIIDVIQSTKEQPFLELSSTIEPIKLSTLHEFNEEEVILNYSKEKHYVTNDFKKQDLTNKVGTYTITYSLVNQKNDEEVLNQTVEIVLLDDIKPTIQSDKKEFEIVQGELFDITKFNFILNDNVTALTMNDVSFSTIDTSKLGKQEITCSVKDGAGNQADLKIMVNIVEKKETETPEGSTTPDTNTTQPSTPTPEPTTPAPQPSTPTPAPSRPNNSNTSSGGNTGNSNASASINGMQFLFSDGYDMSNVMQVCASKISAANASGTCKPIKDANGIYIGAKIELH